MTDRPALDETEERLRRTFERRAGDMAPGDGLDWDPTWTDLVVPPLPHPGDRRPHRRALVAAVAAVTVPAAIGVGVLALTRDGDDGTGRRAGPSTGATTSDPTAATGPAGPDSTGPTAPATGCPLPRVDDGDGLPEETPADTDPNRRQLGIYVRPEMAADGPVQISIEQFTDDGFAGEYPGAEQIQVGDNTGWFLSMEGSGGGLIAIRMKFDELAVVVQGLRVARDELVAVAATVHRGAGGAIEHTPPPGFDSLC